MPACLSAQALKRHRDGACRQSVRAPLERYGWRIVRAPAQAKVGRNAGLREDHAARVALDRKRENRSPPMSRRAIDVQHAGAAVDDDIDLLAAQLDFRLA